VEKQQYKLCVEVLRRLDKAGVLKNLILVGSWCIPFYQDYFKTVKYSSSIRSRDIDFMVPKSIKIKAKVDLVELLKDLGFVVGFRGREGYIRLEHPDLAIEFLVPEKGNGLNKPFPLKELSINAQPLRYLSLLTQCVINAEVDGITIAVPHPAIFAFHKLIVAKIRKNKDKEAKDKEEALRVLRALIDKGELVLTIRFLNCMLPKWKTKVLASLKETRDPELLGALNGRLT
jgi:hypothetical protein